MHRLLLQQKERFVRTAFQQTMSTCVVWHQKAMIFPSPASCINLQYRLLLLSNCQPSKFALQHADLVSIRIVGCLQRYCWLDLYGGFCTVLCFRSQGLKFVASCGGNFQAQKMKSLKITEHTFQCYLGLWWAINVNDELRFPFSPTARTTPLIVSIWNTLKGDGDRIRKC